MASTNQSNQSGSQPTVNVRATVILRIPDLDANELVALYQAINNIVAQFGGEYNVDTMPQNQSQQPPIR